MNITHIIVGHTHPIKLSGTNASLLCSWSSVVTHDVTSRHACHRMTLNLPSHNSVTEVAILTPVQDIPSACSLKQSGHPAYYFEFKTYVAKLRSLIKRVIHQSHKCYFRSHASLTCCYSFGDDFWQKYPFTDCLFLKTQRMKTL